MHGATVLDEQLLLQLSRLIVLPTQFAVLFRQLHLLLSQLFRPLRPLHPERVLLLRALLSKLSHFGVVELNPEFPRGGRSLNMQLMILTNIVDRCEVRISLNHRLDLIDAAQERGPPVIVRVDAVVLSHPLISELLERFLFLSAEDGMWVGRSDTERASVVVRLGENPVQDADVPGDRLGNDRISIALDLSHKLALIALSLGRF